MNGNQRMTLFGDLLEKYQRDAFPTRPHVRTTYLANLRYIEQRWAPVPLREMSKATADIESWLNGLHSTKNPTMPLARQTRKHIRALFHHVCECGIKWGHLGLNPTTSVRITEGSRPKPRDLFVLPEEFKSLMDDPELPQHVKVIFTVIMFTGLRVSEVLGLRWEDIDFKQRVIKVRVSVVGDHIAPLKSGSTEDQIPLSGVLAASLREWRKHEQPINGWVFGSAATGQPYTASIMQSDYLVPAGGRLGLNSTDQQLGWHAFRHTYRCLLSDLGDPLKVQKVLTGTANAGSRSSRRKLEMLARASFRDKNHPPKLTKL